MFGSGDDANFAAGADADSSTRIAQWGAHAPGQVEQRFIVARGSGLPERRECNES
jgi:hypothetical protein